MAKLKDRHQWLASPERGFELIDLTKREEQKLKSLKFFETRRSYGRLVPIQYNRTVCPRLTTKGSTFFWRRYKEKFAFRYLRTT